MLRKESVQLPQEELKEQDLSKIYSMGIGKIFWNPTLMENSSIFNSVCCSGELPTGTAFWATWFHFPKNETLRPHSSRCFSNSLFGGILEKYCLFFKSSSIETSLTDLEKSLVSEGSQDRHVTCTVQKKPPRMSDFKDLSLQPWWASSETKPFNCQHVLPID